MPVPLDISENVLVPPSKYLKKISDTNLAEKLLDFLITEQRYLISNEKCQLLGYNECKLYQ